MSGLGSAFFKPYQPLRKAGAGMGQKGKSKQTYDLKFHSELLKKIQIERQKLGISHKLADNPPKNKQHPTDGEAEIN